jgi:thiamine biosynthesis lipoprotein
MGWVRVADAGRDWLVLLLVATTTTFAGACGAAEATRVIELGGPTMGTTWSVKLVPGQRRLDAREVERLDGQVRDVLGRIDALMSTWNPDSELSRFNRFRGQDPFPVSPDTFAVFKAAVEFAEETEGALDVTVLPLVHAWGFGAGASGNSAPPDDTTLAALVEATGVRHLELDPAGRWVRKRRPDIECDFSALAPGYAADLVAELLAAHLFDGFLLDVGGELVARGRNAEGSLWRVGVDRPVEQRGVAAAVVPLDDLAIATSGDYRSYREVGGVRMTHIIDPRTGRPIGHTLASVTVVDASCTRADALATALMVLGPDEALSMAQRLNLAALLLVRSAAGGFEARTTPRFDALTEES